MPITNPALNWPPIYRQFLTGPVERFRLTPASLALLLADAAAMALAVPVVLAWREHRVGTLWPWLLLVATLQAVLVAALAARWLGERTGLLAGLVQLTMACLLPSSAALPDALFCLVFSLTMGAYMVARVSGRVPLCDRPSWGWIFFLAGALACVLAGPVSLALIFAACACHLIASQDARAWRFFRNPIGLGIFGLVTLAWFVAAWWMSRPCAGLVDWGFFPGPASHTGFAAALALRLAFFAPLALPAICSGLRNGHYATPFWRFLGCWSLGPLALLPFGLFRFDLHFGAILPPLAMAGAVGLGSLLRRVRRSGYASV